MGIAMVRHVRLLVIGKSQLSIQRCFSRLRKENSQCLPWLTMYARSLAVKKRPKEKVNAKGAMPQRADIPRAVGMVSGGRSERMEQFLERPLLTKSSYSPPFFGYPVEMTSIKKEPCLSFCGTDSRTTLLAGV